jgi:hypothetical protein
MNILIGVFFLSSLASAYTFLGGNSAAGLDVTREEPTARFVWNGTAPPITDKEAYTDIDANLNNEDYFAALFNKVARIWNRVAESYLIIELETDPDVTRSSDDLVHSVTVDAVNLSSAAFAVPNIEDGTIIDCDIVIGNKSVKAESLAFILLHELGHCIGLGHNHTEYLSVMGYSKQTRSLSLSLDDRMGISHLYPLDSDAKLEQTFGCGVIAHGHQAYLSLWFLLPLFWIAVLGIYDNQKKSTRGET